jgi:hypothetical protein
VRVLWEDRALADLEAIVLALEDARQRREEW